MDKQDKPLVKESLTSKEREYECVFEGLQNILDNPANRLMQDTRDIIETTIRLFMILDKELTERGNAIRKLERESEACRDVLKDKKKLFLCY